jgi:2-keto-4-pentenoate hydratase
MDDKTIEAIVTQLLQAQEKTQPIPPLTQSYPTITIQDAYRIQFSLLGKKLKRGAQSIGWKAGATGKPVMEQPLKASPTHPSVALHQRNLNK